MLRYLAGLGVVLGCSLCMSAPAFANNPAEAPVQTPMQAPAQQTAPAAPRVPAAQAAQAEQGIAEEGWQKLYEAWEALTPKQQADLYKAREAVDKADCAFIDKAAKYSLIDQELADKMKGFIKERTTAMREANEIPIFRRGMKKSQG